MEERADFDQGSRCEERDHFPGREDGDGDALCGKLLASNWTDWAHWSGRGMLGRCDHNWEEHDRREMPGQR
jgi:hypothetical protein